MTNLTEWYPANIKPVRKGLYETLHQKTKKIQLSLWVPNSICAGFWVTEEGYLYNFKFSSKLKWRGLKNLKGEYK